MGTRPTPLQFVCRGCGKPAQTSNTGNRGIFCSRGCKSVSERKGREFPCRYVQNGYVMLRWNDGGRYVYQLEHRRVWEDANGPIPDGYEIHHVNGDKLDNRLANLRCMRIRDHRSMHKRKYASKQEELAARAEQQRECRARRKMAQ